MRFKIVKILTQTVIILLAILAGKILISTYSIRQIFIIIFISVIITAIYMATRRTIKNIPDDYDRFGF